MKIKVDFDLCESNALCEALAPDVFELDDDDFLQLRTEETTDATIDARGSGLPARGDLAGGLVPAAGGRYMLRVFRVRAVQGAGAKQYRVVSRVTATPQCACYGRAKRARTSGGGH